MPKYSFVLATYNHKELVKNALEALNHQDGFNKGDYEVIISDDGSTENVREYITGVNKNYSLKYIYINRDENSCRAKTRNLGWQAAEGEIVIFIDSDILIKNDYLKQVERYFNKDSNILLFGTRYMLKRDVPIESVTNASVFNIDYFHNDNEEYLEDRHYILNQFSYNPSIHPFAWDLIYTCNIAILKKNLVELKGFDVNFKNWGGEDIDLGYRAQKKGINLVCNSKLEVFHQYHDTNFRVNKESNIENAKYFLQKHPEALSFLPNELKLKILTGGENDKDERELWKEREAHLDHLSSEINKRAGITKEVLIEFKNKRDLSKVKQEINSYSDTKDTIVIVNDYVEETDLDIWIQLLTDLKYRIKYYPVSRKLSKYEICFS